MNFDSCTYFAVKNIIDGMCLLPSSSSPVDASSISSGSVRDRNGKFPTKANGRQEEQEKGMRLKEIPSLLLKNRCFGGSGL